MPVRNVDPRQRRILVVDDDPQSVQIIAKALEFDGYQVDSGHNGKEALGKIQTWQPHLVLLDVSMPGLDGLETLKLLRKKDQYISTIFISGRTKSEEVITGLDAGADDYIRKPFDVLELLARVRSQLRIKELHDQLENANQKLQSLVDIDDLTGLYNMRSLYDKLDHELARAKRYGGSVAVVMMDMDHFKSVNDQNDHLFGSFVLSEVGKIIRNNIREVDFAARYGGDEFLMVLTHIDPGGARVFCERLRKTIKEHLFKKDSSQINLTASMGFAVTPPGGGEIDSRSLVRHADRALYDAKEAGRDTVKARAFQDSGDGEEKGLKSSAS